MTVPGGGPEEGMELLGVPGVVFDGGDGPQLGCVGDEGDVAGEQTAFDGVGQGPADDLCCLSV